MFPGFSVVFLLRQKAICFIRRPRSFSCLSNALGCVGVSIIPDWLYWLRPVLYVVVSDHLVDHFPHRIVYFPLFLVFDIPRYKEWGFAVPLMEPSRRLARIPPLMAGRPFLNGAVFFILRYGCK